jgi:lipoate-protein ligase A
MRVLRGRAGAIDADREASMAMLDEVGATGEPAVRVWRPHRQVAFGRRDAREDGYDRARAAAREHGFPPVERDVGGRAVAYTGTTVAFARAEPIGDIREGLDERYERATGDVARALARLGVDATRGEPPDSFCPGTHSLQATGKLAGIAQRVRQDAAVVAGVLVVADHDAIAAVLDDVYGALGVPFDPESGGSGARGGCDADPDAVVRTVEAELVGTATTTVEQVG